MTYRALLNRTTRALTLASLTLAGSAAFAQQPLRLILGYPPGGSNDVVARLIAPHLGTELGVTVIIENKAGANGTVAASYVAKAAPDGNTLFLVSSSPLAIAPHVIKVPFDTNKDFAAINQIGYTPEAIGVYPGLGIDSLAGLLERAKTTDVRISSSGNGGLPHLTIELLKEATKGRIIHVPYKGGGPAVSDAMAGHVEAVVMDLSALQGQFKAGKLKAVAVTTEKRDPLLPDVPSAAELGYPSVNAANWIGVFAPAKTPEATVAKLHAAIAKVVARPEVQRQLQDNGLNPATLPTPAAFQQFVANDFTRWGKVVKAAGVTAE